MPQFSAHEFAGIKFHEDICFVDFIVSFNNPFLLNLRECGLAPPENKINVDHINYNI